MTNSLSLKIPSVKKVNPREAHTVRAVLTDETKKELDILADRTGIPLSQLTRILIEYALPYVEVIE